MTVRPQRAEGWRGGDGRGPEETVSSRCPRGDVAGHLEEVENQLRFPGEIVRGLGDADVVEVDVVIALT